VYYDHDNIKGKKLVHFHVEKNDEKEKIPAYTRD
jgi:hypothetical protein